MQSVGVFMNSLFTHTAKEQNHKKFIFVLLKYISKKIKKIHQFYEMEESQIT